MTQEPETPASEQLRTREAQLMDWAARVVLEQKLVDGESGELRFSMVSGDASFRRYFRIGSGSKTFIAVDAPPTHEDSARFIHVDELFSKAGVHVPKVFANDLQHGFMLLEDFGDETYLPTLLKAQSAQDAATYTRLYTEAIDALLLLQKGADKERLGPFDRKELRREMDLFPEWMCEKFLGITLDASARAFIDRAFAFLEEVALAQTQVAVHRDYHSRNLLILQSGKGPGVIDFQDAVSGAYTYDLISLLRDCYIAWPQSRIDEWAQYYLNGALETGIVANVTPAQFTRDLDLMGLQRHLKVLGIFCRLYLRDKKSGYLADIPLVIQYFLDVGQRYPELDAFLTWFRGEVLPRARERFTLEV